MGIASLYGRVEICESELRMKVLLIFTLCLMSDGGASKEVTGYSGGGILIKCKYDTAYKDNQKNFCKGSMSVCSDQIKTGDKNQWVNSGRFSLFDDSKSSEFWVMIRELTVQDTGTYQCVVDKTLVRDIYTPVELKVKEDLSYEKSISKSVHVGGDLTVRCKYPQSLRNDPKFLCGGGTQDFACFYKDSVKENKKYLIIDKTALYDDREKQIFNVSIRSVNKQDSEYWCGSEKAWTSDHGYKVYFTRINLTVTDLYVPDSTLKPTCPSSSLLLLTSSTSSSSSSLLRLTDKIKSWTTSASSPAGFPASTVITVSVILLLLIGTITVFVALQKRKKLQDSASTTSGQDPGNQVVPRDICEYEEIKDSRRLSTSDAGNSTIYSTAELPSKLPTSPYDSAVYPTAQLPTIRSDQDIYSTAQLPTCPSAAESDEGLNYTSVIFHAKSTSSNDAAAKIIFKKTEVMCDYDSLSHVTSSG
ncbi:polymeric immunoglobulin receptor-like isoform X2 [Tachysurus fulvidraco]|uniref:polymeric immunoglobulin receptor-like isoform X2 n=1 Tax=Tachysurus fulvidraco TaxID=1234273 RepID=UPI001FED37CE|nr:polymeric immunoglobulin receptor-like isoform X2 [Tachysurus fulvidraco]